MKRKKRNVKSKRITELSARPRTLLHEDLLSKSLDSEGLANLANAGRLVLVLRLNHPTANLTLLQGMTGSTLLIANLFIPIKSCFFNLVNYFFSAIGDNIPKSLSLRIDDCSTVSTRSLDPGQHDDNQVQSAQ